MTLRLHRDWIERRERSRLARDRAKIVHRFDDLLCGGRVVRSVAVASRLASRILLSSRFSCVVNCSLEDLFAARCSINVSCDDGRRSRSRVGCTDRSSGLSMNIRRLSVHSHELPTSVSRIYPGNNEKPSGAYGHENIRPILQVRIFVRQLFCAAFLSGLAFELVGIRFCTAHSSLDAVVRLALMAGLFWAGRSVLVSPCPCQVDGQTVRARSPWRRAARWMQHEAPQDELSRLRVTLQGCFPVPLRI